MYSNVNVPIQQQVIEFFFFYVTSMRKRKKKKRTIELCRGIRSVLGNRL